MKRCELSRLYFKQLPISKNLKTKKCKKAKSSKGSFANLQDITVDQTKRDKELVVIDSAIFISRESTILSQNALSTTSIISEAAKSKPP